METHDHTTTWAITWPSYGALISVRKIHSITEIVLLLYGSFLNISTRCNPSYTNTWSSHDHHMIITWPITWLPHDIPQYHWKSGHVPHSPATPRFSFTALEKKPSCKIKSGRCLRMHTYTNVYCAVFFPAVPFPTLHTVQQSMKKLNYQDGLEEELTARRYFTAQWVTLI